jgi:hypothetical protein
MSFDERFPNIAEWVLSCGWIELGQLQDPSFIQALNEGGVVWDSDENYETLDEALKAMDDALAEFL